MTEQITDKNNILYWYPLIKDLVPTPRTEIIPIHPNWAEDGNNLVVSDEELKKVEEAAKGFKFPLFMRGSNSSGKHDWKDTCFVEKFSDIRQHILNLAYSASDADILGVPCGAIALRELIDMQTGYTAFHREMPVNKERRYFISDHKVLCHHPYWIEDAIRNPSVNNWREISKELNKETEKEIKTLTTLSQGIADKIEGYWSIDFCFARAGTWYMIDMATGERSWHPKECHFASNQNLNTTIEKSL